MASADNYAMTILPGIRQGNRNIGQMVDSDLMGLEKRQGEKDYVAFGSIVGSSRDSYV